MADPREDESANATEEEIKRYERLNGSRKIMEIVEATGIENGEIQATTLFRFDIETEQHLHVGVISDKLAQRLLDDGVDSKTLKRFCSNDFFKKSERRLAI